MTCLQDRTRLGRVQILGLLGLLAAGLALWLAIGQRDVLHNLWHSEPRIAVVLGDREFEVAASEAHDLEQLSRDHLHGAEEQLRGELEDLVSTELDALFSDLHDRVPDFADWYYSLSGKYERRFFWGLNRLRITGSDLVIGRLETMFHEQIEDTDYLDRLNRAGARKIEVQQQLARNELLDHWLERLDGRDRAPAPDREPEARLSLNEFLPALEINFRSDFEVLLEVSGAALLSSSAAATAWRLVGQRTATAAGAGLAARSASRGAARAGAGAGASAGATSCAPSGPVAVGCAAAGAVVFGGAAWVTSDWGLLQLDERRNREAMEDALHDAIATQREDLERQLLRHWHDVVAQHYQGMQREVERTFIPIRALSAG